MDHSHHNHHHGESGHDKHAGHHTEDFIRKFWVVFFLTIPVLVYSEVFEKAFGFRLPDFTGSRFFILALGSAIFFYGGWVFIKGAVGEIKARLPGMMTLIALATSAAYLWSIYATFFGEHTLFWELSTLIAIMLLGHFIEMRAVMGATGALRELAKLLPDTATIIRGKEETSVSLSELVVGDMVLVKPGARIPADGNVAEGESEVDESIITGESRPVMKRFGDEVIAGSVNGDGALTVIVTKIGESTFLAGVMRLVAEAERSKSKLQLLADRAALWLTGIAIAGGSFTFVAWFLSGAGVAFSIERLVAVLVIACPHALGLAIPLVASISTTMAAQNGFLVKRRLSLEAARSVDTVIFDKTGTLTEGRFSVISTSSEMILALAAAVESRSEHPIAKAIVDEAKKRKLERYDAKDFRRISGAGAEGVVDGRRVFVGHRGAADIVVEVDGRQEGVIAVSDVVRPESKDAVRGLKDMGLSIAMITGDAEDVAKKISDELGIDKYFARVAPGEKSEKVRLLQKGGKKVAFVGDGVNDAPALTQSDLGIAVGAGTNVAIESAGIILMRNDPRDIPKIINLSRLTYKKMVQNLFWATGYNVVAMPLAAGVLFSFGIMLEPAAAAVLMSLSTVIVAFNAVLLRRSKV